MNCLTAILAALVLTLSQVFSPENEGRDSVRIYFRQNASTYSGSYLGNDQSLARLSSLVEGIGEEQLQGIDVESYASPEGVYERNMQLCRERARSSKVIVKNAIPAWAESKLSASSAGISWNLLRERVCSDSLLTDTSRDKILKILAAPDISPATRQWRLENRLGQDPRVGSVYSYLLRTHYRQIRGCHVIVRYTVPDDSSVHADTLVLSPADVQPVAVQPADSMVVTADSTVPAQPVTPEAGAASPVAVAAVPVAGAVMDAAMDLLKPDRRPFMGISTNLLYDATYVPGYGFTSIPSGSLEFYPAAWKHFSVGANVEWPMWRHPDTHRYLQIQNIGVWTRRYFKERDPHAHGLYLSAGANLFRYGIGFNAEKGWEGEGLGGSVGVGYKRMIGRSRWWWDAGIDLGVYWSRYDPYVYGNDATNWYYYDYDGDPAAFQERRKRFVWVGPTRVYFSIGYDLTVKRKRK